ncbi:MAG: nucleotidyltransferase family protein [Fimbriimonadaceae bacterium]
MRKEQLLQELQSALPDLRERYPILSFRLFGSFATDSHEAGSDVDLVVELERPLDYSAFLDLSDKLEDVLGRPIDLLTMESLTENMRQRIASHWIHVAGTSFVLTGQPPTKVAKL